jgi:Response regulator receiver domain
MLGFSLRCPSRRNTVVVAVACALLALSQSTNLYTFWEGRVGTFGQAFAMTLPTWALMAACAPLIAWLARTYTFAPHNRARSAAVHVVAGLIFALVHNASLTLIYSLLLAHLTPALDNFAVRFRITLAYHFYQDVLAYGVLLATFLALATGREALALIGEALPDLVFLDVQMPGIDGFEVLDRVA